MSRPDDVLGYLDARSRELVEFARELIACPSENPPGDERAVAALCLEQFRQLGVVDCVTLAAEETRPNLVARVPGLAAAGRRLILSGHLDTKPAGDRSRWLTDPWDPVVEDGQLYGLGSGDMKAAVAAMIFAAGAIHAAGGTDGELIVVLTADEEAGSKFGSRWLAENGHLQADAAIIGEPCGIETEWEAIDLVSRGAALFRIAVHGTQMHSSVSDRLPAINATVKMARLLDQMERSLRDRLTYIEHQRGGLGPTVNIGVTARAGVHYGVYPGYAEFGCDIRTLPGMTRDQLEADLNEFLDAARSQDPELDAELIFDGWFPATEIDEDHQVVTALTSAACRVLRKRPAYDAFPGATDATHFQLTAGIPTVPAFGPGLLPRAHSPNERLAVESIGQAAQMYALAAQDYLSAPSLDLDIV